MFPSVGSTVGSRHQEHAQLWSGERRDFPSIHGSYSKPMAGYSVSGATLPHILTAHDVVGGKGRAWLQFHDHERIRHSQQSDPEDFRSVLFVSPHWKCTWIVSRLQYLTYKEHWELQFRPIQFEPAVSNLPRHSTRSLRDPQTQLFPMVVRFSSACGSLGNTQIRFLDKWERKAMSLPLHTTFVSSQCKWIFLRKPRVNARQCI